MIIDKIMTDLWILNYRIKTTVVQVLSSLLSFILFE